MSSADEALLAAHLKMATKWLQKCGPHGNSVAREQTRDVSLNVYHDPAPQELGRARDVLLAVISGAEKYLKDWPEHPVLNQVQCLLHTYTHTHARACMHTHAHIHTHAHTHARMHARTHTPHTYSVVGSLACIT